MSQGTIPAHLADTIATGEKEGELVAQFEIGNLKNFVYLILDWTRKKAAIVDPQNDLSIPLGCLKRHDFDLTAIFLTHTHFDHIAGVPELIRKFPQVPILVHRADQYRLSHAVLNYGKIQSVQDGETVEVGDLRVRVFHTPGHSEGECCYFLESTPPYLFTGDTVFIRDCGRTDFEGGSNEAMFQSLKRISKFRADTVILPGHHYQKETASWLGRELVTSPPFQCKSAEELQALP